MRKTTVKRLNRQLINYKRQNKFFLENLNICQINQFYSIVLKGCFFIYSVNKNYFASGFNQPCIYTGRNRGVLRKFGVSRILYKYIMHQGLIASFKVTNT